MQRSWVRRAAPTRQVGNLGGWGSIGVLTLGLMASGCVGAGQLAHLIEPRDPAVAFEVIEGPPSAIVQKLVKSLEQEASTRRVPVAPASEANYRLHGYLAAHAENGATAISWTLEAYDSDQRRAFRLSGEEKASGHLWAAASDQVLQRIARTSIQQFVALAAAQSDPAPLVAGSRLASLRTAWFDDWTPEAWGIFRVFQRETKPEIAADAGAPLPPDQVPLPRARPAPSPSPSGTVFAFASQDH